jgi:hypothetical protein
MKKTILIALLCTGVSMAHAGWGNGQSLNGISINGAAINGVKINGLQPNGTEHSCIPGCRRPVDVEPGRQLQAAPHFTAIQLPRN